MFLGLLYVTFLVVNENEGCVEVCLTWPYVLVWDAGVLHQVVLQDAHRTFNVAAPLKNINILEIHYKSVAKNKCEFQSIVHALWPTQTLD